MNLIHGEALDKHILDIFFQRSVVCCRKDLDLPQKRIRLGVASFDHSTILLALSLREMGHAENGFFRSNGRDFPGSGSFGHDIEGKESHEEESG